MAYAAKILADSISPEGARLTTFEVTFPRFILAEVNTHRMLSRNSASSRAIPVAKSIDAVLEDPFIPASFPQNQPGMVGGDSLDDEAGKEARTEWESALQYAVYSARKLEKLGVHKGWANRLLEPFKWHTAIITATEWENFFALRTDENAQPEFRKIALMMKDVMDASTPIPVGYEEWHLPLIDWRDGGHHPDLPGPKEFWDYWKKVSVGRCARVSCETHDGKRDPERDIELHDRLLTNGHMSPFEHIATPAEVAYAPIGNLYGWVQYRKHLPNEDNFARVREAAQPV